MTLKNPPAGADQALLRGLQGKVAIAQRKAHLSALQENFQRSALAGSCQHAVRTTQRVLWASTGTKNPAYSDVLYVEELIGPDTVNTVPPATFDAFRDHGKPRASLEQDLDAARKTMADLERAGISMKAVTDQLTEDGVKLFADAFDKLLAAVEKQAKLATGSSPSPSR